MFKDKCPRCNSPLECLGGASAHPNNWYCIDNVLCGWQAWGADPNPPLPLGENSFEELSAKAHRRET